MKWILLIGFLLLQKQISAKMQLIKGIDVKEATVYLQGAKVYGETHVNIKQGRNLIKIIGLPNDLNEQTYKVHLQKYVTLLSIVPSYNNNNEFDSLELTIINKNKSLEKAIALLDIEMKNIIGEQQIINNHLKIQVTEKQDHQTQLERLTAFYSQRMMVLDKKLFEISEQKLKLKDSLNVYQEKIAISQNYKLNNQKELLLELEAQKSIDLNLGLSYLVNNAGWMPNYDLKFGGFNQSLELIYKGQIYQRTGQDWKDIKLWVSTYKPLYNQNRPILSLLYVAEYIPYKESLAEKSAITSESNTLVNSYQLRKDFTESDKPLSVSSDEILNIIYELNYKQTLLSQDHFQYVILDKRKLNASFKYHAVPKQSNQVYLMAYIKDWQQYNLVRGEANIFFEENYVGKTTIQNEYLKDELPISLGADERIVLKRILLQDKTTSKNSNANKWETITYEISIRNGTKNNIEVEILDQLPISENSKVAVKLIDINDGKFDEQTGSIIWERTINAGYSNNIQFSYEVKYPKDMKIYYFNR